MLNKPHEKELPSLDRYSDLIQEQSKRLCSTLSNSQIEAFEDLVAMIYKTAYIDGWQDALFMLN